jgi:hypothetical protein
MNKKIVIISVAIAATSSLKAQNAFGDRDELRVITTAVPFLFVAPDARAGGMGEVGAASLPDANSIHWNPSKLAFLEDGTQAFSMNYAPWLRNLVPDINLAYISYAQKLGSNQGLAFSLRYFSLGDVQFRNEFGDDQGTFSPYEFALDGAYALKLSTKLSGGIALRYIFSDLTQGTAVQGLQTNPGQSFAADVSFFYKSEVKNLQAGRKGYYTAGLNISNLGAKISYSESGESDFLPTNMRLGGGYHWIMDDYNRFSIYGDVNKLLVPSPGWDSTASGNRVLVRSNASAFQGVFQSFSDAPGGFSEEMRELVLNIGGEYWYDETFAFRGGYQYEDATKGNRKYFTLGVGIKWNYVTLDFCYLIPASQTVRSPLENTLRFGLSLDFGKMNAE